MPPPSPIATDRTWSSCAMTSMAPMAACSGDGVAMFDAASASWTSAPGPPPSKSVLQEENLEILALDAVDETDLFDLIPTSQVPMRTYTYVDPSRVGSGIDPMNVQGISEYITSI
uniref:Uncharacterized protein n=1 Tax=Triticum urartu TaxID=4572 RepID=A0A8R7QP78_TRIUA